jgi:hypothetical protein
VQSNMGITRELFSTMAQKVLTVSLPKQRCKNRAEKRDQKRVATEQIRMMATTG